MQVKVGLWPLSGNYGKKFTDTYIEQFIFKALEIGFYHFDFASSYGDEAFRRCLSRIVKSDKNIGLDTKVRVDFCDPNWKNLLKRNVSDITHNYEHNLNRIFLHNPEGTVEEKNSALRIISSFSEQVNADVGISLKKDDYKGIEALSAGLVQLDLNPTYCAHIENVLERLEPSKVEARSLFGAGLLLAPLNDFNQYDQRSRWASPARLSASQEFRRRLPNHFSPEHFLSDALISFPQLWGIEKVVLGTTDVNRLKQWKRLMSGQGNAITKTHLKCMKEAGNNLFCF